MTGEFSGLVIAAFCAGFVDAVAGGGGLIQVPALLAALPETLPAMVFGTNKLSSIFGTASASWRYLRRVSIPWKIAAPVAVSAFLFSFVGAACVAWLPTTLIRPIVFGLLIAVVCYVAWQPQLGTVSRVDDVTDRGWFAPVVVGCSLGFYDGFFGPGTGSFLIFCFVRFFGLSFIEASASAKVVNLATNAAALSFFIPSGNVLFALGLAMAVANVVGAQFGAKAALRGGSVWVRRVFLLVALMLIFKIGADLIP